MFPRCFSLGTPRGILVPQAPGEAHGCVYVVPKLAKAADAVPSDAANVRANDPSQPETKPNLPMAPRTGLVGDTTVIK